MSQSHSKKPKLVIRNAERKDAPAIVDLSARVYPHSLPYKEDQLFGIIHNFHEGQFVAEYEGKIVGFCSTFRISGAIALKPHTWKEITGSGYASRHDPNGDYLYGLEVCVDQEKRGLRIGQRFYNERKKLCSYLRLKGIIFGGRMPGYHKKAKQMSPQEYVDAIKNRKLRDPVISFQMKNGFEILGVLPDYLTMDPESHNFAVHMVWKNPKVAKDEDVVRQGPAKRLPDTVRVAAVQYKMRKVASFEEFQQTIAYFVDVVADYKCDFVVFPEMFTLQLLSINNDPMPADKAIEALTRYTKPLNDFMSKMAVRYNVNIIGGSHPTKVEDGSVENICHVYLRDGSVHSQAKIHPTPNERDWWHIKGGSDLQTIQTDCGPIGVLICYDCEFPELARHLVNQGAQILFVPFCTDERQSYLRVRYCAQARAVENQCYVVMAGTVGNLPKVHNMDIQYAQSCILTPCDFGFARDGIAADTTPNVEMIAVADFRFENLNIARHAGTVRNLQDRRFDLYHVSWKKS